MRKGKRVALAVSVASGLATLYAAGRVATAYWDFGAAAGELPKALREYRAAGLPWSAAEVAPSHLDAGENPAAALRAAGKMLHPGPKGDLTQAIRNPGPASDALVVGYAKPLALVEAVADRPRVDFARDWDLGPYILFPEYADMKTLAKAAVLRAVRSAGKGDDTAALRDLTLARRLGLWADQEPTLISVLVRIAIESIAIDGAERCVAAAAGSPGRIARYEGWLDLALRPPDFRNALRGEAWMGVTTARNLEAFGGKDTLWSLARGDMNVRLPKIDPTKLRREGLPDGVTARGFLARHLQLWNEASRTTDGFRQPPESVGKRLDAIEMRIETEKGLSYVYDRIMMAVFGGAGEAVTTLDARRAVGRGFAEAMAFHAKRGTWPLKVSQTDPFTGSPLRVKAGKDFRVYSVGRDRKDDGGVLHREAKPGTKGEDLVAAYPPVS